MKSWNDVVEEILVDLRSCDLLKMRLGEARLRLLGDLAHHMRLWELVRRPHQQVPLFSAVTLLAELTEEEDDEVRQYRKKLDQYFGEL